MKKTRVKKSRDTVPLKGISFERGWVKSAENIGPFPLKRGFLINTTFNQSFLSFLSTVLLGWPAKFREMKFREMFREIFISHFTKFSNDFREILRNFVKQNV